MKLITGIGCSLLAGIIHLRGADESAKNLIPNPGFEAGNGTEPEAWRFSLWKNATKKWDDSQSFRGEKSVLIEGQNAGWATNFPVETRSNHSVSFRYRVEGGPAKVVLYIRDLANEDASKKIVIYSSRRAITADETGHFREGAFVDGADENGWVLFDGGEFSGANRTGTLQFMIKLVSERPDARLWIDDVIVSPVAAVKLPPTSAILERTPEATIWWEDEIVDTAEHSLMDLQFKRAPQTMDLDAPVIFSTVAISDED